MDKKLEQNGTHFKHHVTGNGNLKEQEAKASMTKSTSGLNNHTKAKETIVTINQGGNGCFFSRAQVTVFMVAFFLTIGAVFVLVMFLGRTVNTVTFQPESCSCRESLLHSTNKPKHVESSPHPVVTNEMFTQMFKVRLPDDVVPLHYDLELDIEDFYVHPNPSFYSGTVDIVVDVVNSTHYIIFHIKTYFLNIINDTVSVRKLKRTTNIDDVDYDVIDVSDDDVFVDIDSQYTIYESEQYVIKVKEPLESGERYVISIGRFEGQLRKDLTGLYRSSYKDKNGTERILAASQLQSTDARKVFPCFDEPAMKATFSVTVTHLNGYTALGNMPVESERCVDDCSKKRVKFQRTPKMSTYILAFVVSDFKYTETTLPNNYTLRLWSQPEMINQTLYALQYAADTYAFFTDYFQISDVVPKADHVAVPDFSGGAMENWGLVIYREVALLYDPEVSSSSNKYMVTLIVAHEIAHTWFGNMVTMEWWDDLWLNEGFASTLMYFAMDNAYPDWHVLDIVVVEDIFPVMVKDGLVTSHPVSVRIDHPNEVDDLFDQISYTKGMAVLRMLESFLGKEGFRTGLQVYVNKYKYSNANMSELWATFTEATQLGFDIGTVMDTWTRQMGYPVINVKLEGDHYTLRQSRFLYNPETTEGVNDSPYGYKWYVPFMYMEEGDPGVKLEWLNMSDTHIKKTSDGWLLGNIDYAGFYRINYDADLWSSLAYQLNTNHTVFAGANRAGLIGDALNLARASQLDYAVALNVTTYLHDEESYVPWKAFLESLEFIRGMLSKKSAYVLLEKYIHDLISPVFKKIGTEERGTLPEMYLRRKLLRTGCDVGVKEAIKYATDRFKDWMENGGRLPTDFSQVIYAIGIREGSVDEWDYVWEKSQNTNSPSEREMMLEALAHTQKPWLLWRYANWIFDDKKIKKQDVRLVMSYFSNTPIGRMIALHFLMNRWSELNEKFGEDTFIIREMIGDVTAFINTDFELRQLDLLFTEQPPKGGGKGADSAISLIRANIRWMELNYNSIEQWLVQHVGTSF